MFTCKSSKQKSFPKQKKSDYINCRNHYTTLFKRQTCAKHKTRRAIRGEGTFAAFAPPEIFKTLHRNFKICRNFQRIKMKFYVLVIFKKSYWNFFVMIVNYLYTRIILKQVI